MFHIAALNHLAFVWMFIIFIAYTLDKLWFIVFSLITLKHPGVCFVFNFLFIMVGSSHCLETQEGDKKG